MSLLFDRELLDGRYDCVNRIVVSADSGVMGDLLSTEMGVQLMEFRELAGKKQIEEFVEFGNSLYQDNPYKRRTDEDILRILIGNKSFYHTHASVKAFLVYDNAQAVARFALIHDQKLPEYIQIAFFEARPNIAELTELMVAKASGMFPLVNGILAGMNGHFFYGAGFLLNRFDSPQPAGLPYSLPYYAEYFRGFSEKRLHSFRFPVQEFYRFRKKYTKCHVFEDIQVRYLNTKDLVNELKIYTHLSNQSFGEHTYWSSRDYREELEIFLSYRHIITKENLLFAEHKGIPVGFLFWFPDINELLKNNKAFTVWHLLRHKISSPVRTFFLSTIGILPEYRKTRVMHALMCALTDIIEKTPYQFGEGGFVFEDNTRSMSMTNRYFERALGVKAEPYRSLALYEKDIKELIQ
jgi:hypothetical protein